MISFHVPIGAVQLFFVPGILARAIGVLKFVCEVEKAMLKVLNVPLAVQLKEGWCPVMRKHESKTVPWAWDCRTIAIPIPVRVTSIRFLFGSLEAIVKLPEKEPPDDGDSRYPIVQVLPAAIVRPEQSSAILSKGGEGEPMVPIIRSAFPRFLMVIVLSERLPTLTSPKLIDVGATEISGC